MIKIIIISILFSVFTSANYIFQFIRMPKDHVFIGVTQYWEDFFYYLDQFYQGAHGAWLTANNFTTEPFSSTPFYFINILLGKIGGIFHLEPYLTFNLFVFIFKFGYLLISYLLIRIFFPRNFRYRFYTFIVFLFATSFPLNGKPFEIFRAENTIFTRFGSSPSMYVVNSIFIAVFICFYLLIKKLKVLLPDYPIKTVIQKLFPLILVTSFFSFLLSFVDVAKLLVAIGVLFCGFLFIGNVTGFKKLTVTSSIICAITFIPSIITVVFLYLTLSGISPYKYANDWDLLNHNLQINFLISHPGYYFMIFGIVGIITMIGLWAYRINKNHSILENLAASAIILSFIGYFIPYSSLLPIPGFRFLFPSIYIFMAVFAFYGLRTINFYIKNRWKKGVLGLLVLAYVFINSLTFISTLYAQTKPIILSSYAFSYIPNTLYESLMFIRKIPQKDAIVLSHSQTETDHLIPGLTGKRSYTGHRLMTVNAIQKDKLSNDFFERKLSSNEAFSFLKKNNIKYILYTGYDGNPNELVSKYPFLKDVFLNNFSIVFTLKDKKL